MSLEKKKQIIDLEEELSQLEAILAQKKNEELSQKTAILIQNSFDAFESFFLNAAFSVRKGDNAYTADYKEKLSYTLSKKTDSILEIKVEGTSYAISISNDLNRPRSFTSSSGDDGRLNILNQQITAVKKDIESIKSVDVYYLVNNVKYKDFAAVLDHYCN
jgi:hypothetical protein